MYCWDTYYRPKAHGRPEEKLVEFKTGVEGCFMGIADVFIFDVEVDGAVFIE